jgi:hypothetical protein
MIWKQEPKPILISCYSLQFLFKNDIERSTLAKTSNSNLILTKDSHKSTTKNFIVSDVPLIKLTLNYSQFYYKYSCILNVKWCLELSIIDWSFTTSWRQPL